MGFFSWLTADTGESIANIHSTRKTRTVYLLQPNGEPPIEEPAYGGYGMFGGTDAHVWLARHNLPAEKLAPLSNEQLRGVGVTLEVGSFYVDQRDGSKHAIFDESPSLIDPSIMAHLTTYDGHVPSLGGIPNDLIEQGVLVEHQFELQFPLKFSFDPNAVYEDLERSADCDHQGFFYDDEAEAA